jgi:hypothetical protein
MTTGVDSLLAISRRLEGQGSTALEADELRIAQFRVLANTGWPLTALAVMARRVRTDDPTSTASAGSRFLWPGDLLISGTRSRPCPALPSRGRQGPGRQR